jgi:MFS family permease
LAAVKQDDPGFAEPSLLSFRDLYTLTPTGMIGCLLTGGILSSLYSIFPIMFEAASFSRVELSTMMFAVLFGGMCWQYPLGKLSDIMPRRNILVVLAGASFILLFIGLFFYEESSWSSMLVFFLIGGACYPLYPLTLSHAGDVVPKKDTTAAMQGFVLMFAIGSSFGPIFSSLFMEVFGGAGALISVMVISVALLVVFVWRHVSGIDVSVAKQKDFIDASSGTRFFGKKKLREKK